MENRGTSSEIRLNLDTKMSSQKVAKFCNKTKVTTHLFMNNKKINDMNKLKITKDLKVIYLQNNSINSIDNLNCAINLTHLYLHHNQIKKMTNLYYLGNLTKLYLGYNMINVVEGLENMTNLIELHIENQQLEPGTNFYIEPKTKMTLARNLEHLNISGNNLKSLIDIHGFSKLKVLSAKSNAITNIDEVTETISSLSNLLELNLRENPVSKSHKYCEDVISSGCKLKILDGKLINDTTREFMKKFKKEKQRHLASKRSQTSLSDDITSSLNLPLSFRLSISRAIRDQYEPNLSVPLKSSSIELHSPNISHWKSAKNNKTRQVQRKKQNLVERHDVTNDLLQQCAVAIPLLKK